MSDKSLLELSHDNLHHEVIAHRTFVAQVDNYFDGRPLGPEGIKILMAMNHFLSLLEDAVDEEITLVEQIDFGKQMPEG